MRRKGISFPGNINWKFCREAKRSIDGMKGMQDKRELKAS
jgi:hypothetical protein